MNVNKNKMKDRQLHNEGHLQRISAEQREYAERTLNNILPYMEGKLFLKVNREKTCVAHISNVKYLGYTFYNHKGIRFRVHSKSVEKMKNKLRELTDRNNGRK